MIFYALKELCPNCDFSITDDTLTWRSDPSSVKRFTRNNKRN